MAERYVNFNSIANGLIASRQKKEEMDGCGGDDMQKEVILV